jgi:hypothetical protein
VSETLDSPTGSVIDRARIALCIDRMDRDHLIRFAALHDRTLSAEVRRAVRAYLVDPQAAERALRQSGASNVLMPGKATRAARQARVRGGK